MNLPPLPDPIPPALKVRKQVRQFLHARGFHDLCRIRWEYEVKGYDTSPKFLVGMEHEIEVVDPETGETTTRIEREVIEATTFGGDPIYSGKIIEVHW